MRAAQYLILFFMWLSDHIRLQSIFTPFSAVNKMTVNEKGEKQSGVIDYYFFFIRVARIQKTVPWIYK